MASTAKEDTGQSSSSSSEGSQSQQPPAEEDSRCPICLGRMWVPAYVTYCMHKFCLKCIWQWCRARDDCPVCRQLMEQVLHSVRGDRDYKECSIGLGARLHRRVARERGLQPGSAAMLRVMQTLQDQQHFYESALRQEAAPGPSRGHSQQASQDTALLREGKRPAGPAAPLEPQNGTE